MNANCDDVVEAADALIVTHANPLYRQAIKNAGDKPVIDVVRINAELTSQPNYNGIGW
jgi:hypothetical protein